MLEQALTVAAAKAKVFGLVVAAAAVGGTAAVAGSTGFVPTAGDTAAPAVSASPTDAAPTDAAPTPTDAAPAPTDAAPVSPAATVSCPPDVQNHGQFVSSVARDKTLKGAAHGAAVSAAAQSDCGKTAADATAATTDTQATEAPEVEATDAPDVQDSPDATETPAAPKAKTHGKKSH